MSKTTFAERTEKHKLKMLYEVKQLEIFFKNTFNLDLYLIYGTLLGAVRDKDFIPFDTDIDLAYFSKCNNSFLMRKEFLHICDVLKDKNLFKRARGYKHIDCGAISDKFYFDIWSSYIENNVFYLAPFKQVFKSDTFIPLKEINFKGTLFKIPNNPEIFLEAFYKSWKTPIQTDYRKIKY
jgi:phosphorylcholine metabolism protein LicD